MCIRCLQKVTQHYIYNTQTYARICNRPCFINVIRIVDSNFFLDILNTGREALIKVIPCVDALLTFNFRVHLVWTLDSSHSWP